MRLLRHLTLTCLVLGASTPAWAAPDAVELQLPAANLLDLITDRARAAIDCFDPIPFRDGSLIVDHVELPPSPSLRRSPTPRTVVINADTSFSGHPTELVLPLRIFLKTAAALADPAVPQENYAVVIDFSLISSLEVSLDANGRPQLCAAPSALEPENGLGPQLLALLQDRVGTACFPLRLTAIERLLGAGVATTGIGISSNVALDRLAIRVEFDRQITNVAAWQAFVDDGALTPTAGDFAIAIDRDLIGRSMIQRVETQLAEAEGAEDITLSSAGVQVAWAPGTPAFELYLAASYDTHGICPNLLGFDASIFSTIGLAENNTVLRMTGHGEWSKDADDLAACVLAWGGFMPIVLLDPVLAGVLHGVFSMFSLPELPSDECTIDQDLNVECNFDLDLPVLAAGGSSDRRTVLSASSVGMLGSNLVISGNAVNEGLSKILPRAIINDVDIQYGIFGGCSSLHIGIEGRLAATGSGRLCRAIQIEDDPQQVFHIDHASEIHAAPFNNEVWYGGGNTAAYAQNPYEAKVTVQTSGGGRTVGISFFDAPTPEEIFETQNDYVMAYANCMAKSTGLFGIPGKFDIRWKVDPPYDLVATIASSDPLWARRTARVTLEGVSVETLGRTTRPRTLDGSYFFERQELLFTGTAIVDFGREGRFRVPVSTVVASSLSGREIGETEIVTGALAGRTVARFTISSREFPRAVSSVQLGVDVSPVNLAMQGTLTVE